MIDEVKPATKGNASKARTRYLNFVDAPRSTRLADWKSFTPFRLFRHTDRQTIMNYSATRRGPNESALPLAKRARIRAFASGLSAPRLRFDSTRYSLFGIRRIPG